MRHYAKRICATLTASLYATALRLFRSLADEGDPAAQGSLLTQYRSRFADRWLIGEQVRVCHEAHVAVIRVGTKPLRLG
jgi:hypothetical protein